MTPPPPVLAGLRTGNREMRRRAPVSDRPGAGPVAAGSSLPPRGVVLSLALPPAQFFVGLDWAGKIHAVCVMDQAGKIVDQFTIAHTADGIAMLIRRLATARRTRSTSRSGSNVPTAGWSTCCSKPGTRSSRSPRTRSRSGGTARSSPGRNPTPATPR